MIQNTSNNQRGSQVSAASFRDPSGFVFFQDGVVYRQINNSYRDAYGHLVDSGLYAKLVGEGMLIVHEEVDQPVADKRHAWRIIRPEPVVFVSYPYEWCFSQLKDAALLTLDIQLAAIEYKMCLKDASAYNVQFHNGRPVMIDTLSFEPYSPGQPWVAYRQFCQHFLAPLALMANLDVRLAGLLPAYIDGIPLDLASALLPRRTWFSMGLLTHLHIHAVTQKKYSNTAATGNGKAPKSRPISKAGLIGIVRSLRNTVKKLDLLGGQSEWAAYYSATNYSEEAFESKKSLVRQFLKTSHPRTVWDLGGNTGVFSRIASAMGIPTVSCDIDPFAVESNYRDVQKHGEKNLLPLWLDLTNPSAGIGWNNNERESFANRGPVDCIMALALIHHLSITNNVPFEKIAAFFYGLCTWLIIEFVPKEDSQVQRLLSSRVDIFQDYDRFTFETVFSRYFAIVGANQVDQSKRTLYLMHKKGA